MWISVALSGVVGATVAYVVLLYGVKAMTWWDRRRLAQRKSACQ